MLPPRSDAPPTQNGPKTDLRVRSKMAKSRFFLLFQLLWPKWCMPYDPNVSYGVKLLNRHLFVKLFFRLTFLQKIFALENFRKFRLKKFSTNEIRDMEVQQRAKFSLTKPHHIVLKSTATSYLCGSFKKITILRSFSQ